MGKLRNGRFHKEGTFLEGVQSVLASLVEDVQSIKASVKELKASTFRNDYFDEYAHHAHWAPYTEFVDSEHSWNVLAKEFVPPAGDERVFSKQDLLKCRPAEHGQGDPGIPCLTTATASDRNSANPVPSQNPVQPECLPGDDKVRDVVGNAGPEQSTQAVQTHVSLMPATTASSLKCYSMDDLHTTTISCIKFVGDLTEQIHVISGDIKGAIQLTEFRDGTFRFKATPYCLMTSRLGATFSLAPLIYSQN